MFNLLQNASDDQTAIGACLLTLASAAFLVFASYHVGPAGRKLKQKSLATDLPATRISTKTSHERAA